MDNFKKELLANIETEITQLGGKITRIRENRDNGAEYRNLIQAYKEIVDIYYKVKDDLQKESSVDNNKICNIESTICTINRLEYMDKMSEIPDIKILTEKDNNTWEVRKKLTPDNHLLFLEGELFSPNGYLIDGKKITLRCDGKMKACMRVVWLDDNTSEKIDNYTTEDFLNFKEKFIIEDYKLIMEDNLDFCRFSHQLHYSNHILYLNGKSLNVFFDYTYVEFGKEIFFTQDGIEKLYGNTMNKDEFISPLIKGIKLKKGDFLKIVWLENNDSKIKELEKRLEKLEAIKEN